MGVPGHSYNRACLRPLVQFRGLLRQSTYVMDGRGDQAPPGADRLEHVSQIKARSRVTVAGRRRGVDGMKLQKETAVAVVIVVGVESVGFELRREVFTDGRGGSTVPLIGKVPHSAKVAGNGPIAGRGRRDRKSVV